MSHYADLIAEFLPADRRNPEAIALAEMFMREEYPALDAMDRVEFAAGLMFAWEQMLDMAATTPNLLTSLADANRVEVPAWLNPSD